MVFEGFNPFHESDEYAPRKVCGFVNHVNCLTMYQARTVFQDAWLGQITLGCGLSPNLRMD